MLPVFLITFREVMEASLIVATILGILIKLDHRESIKTVWLATSFAVFFSMLFLAISSFLGLKVQQLYSGELEKLIEGSLMVISAIFITWAVFFLHKYFAHHKANLLKKVGEAIQEEQKGLFILTFTAVLREGLEIVLFLSTIFLSTNPGKVLNGFLLGVAGGLIICLCLIKFTLRLPIKLAFKATNMLLILFAAGLLARGLHEFMELGILPETQLLTLMFIPTSNLIADFIKIIFGITRSMDMVQITVYLIYTIVLSWLVLFRKQTIKN